MACRKRGLLVLDNVVKERSDHLTNSIVDWVRIDLEEVLGTDAAWSEISIPT
jgi:hypothetical protein